MNCFDVKNEFLINRSIYCSPETVVFYDDSLKKFYDWLSLNYNLDSTSVFNLSVFQDYMLYLRDCNIKNTSINTYFRAVRAFCSYMYDHGYINKNYCIAVKSLRSDHEEKIPLTASDVASIDACFDFTDMISLRNYLIFHLMLDCGLRRGEVVNLKRSDFNFDLAFISFIGKGSKKRVVPLPEFLIDYFKLYFDSVHSCEFAFVKNDNEPINNSTVKMMIQRLKTASGVKRLTAHLLRHTFATSFIAGGGSLEFLRLLMGHSSYNVTLNYLHVAQICDLLQIDLYKIDDCFFDFSQKKRSA